MKSNPFIINFSGTILYLIVVLIILFTRDFSGGASLEFFVEAIMLYPIIGLASNIIMVFLFKEWCKKHWLITIFHFTFFSSFLLLY